jgi:hypothetical protein
MRANQKLLPTQVEGLPPLPPPTTRRWVTSRKVAVIAAVRSGAISLDEACQRYSLSREEFSGWIGMLEKHGAPGLRVTRIQIYRDAAPPRR